MSWKIVTDSTSDLYEGMPTAEGVSFAIAPLRIIVGQEEFIDDATLNVQKMMHAMEAFKGGSSSACPSPEDWAKEFRQADFSIAITITSALSGSYNSALVGRDMVLEEDPTKKIYVIDSLSTAGPLRLIARKVNDLIAAGKPFDEVVEEAESYNKSLELLFTLSSFDNLVKNGRMNKLVGFVAGALKIRAVGKATEKGELGILHKVRGEVHTFTTLVKEMAKMKDPATWGTVIISHCFNENGALFIKNLIQQNHPGTDIEIHPTRGLNSFYAELSGILVAF